ncbi:hypothetical protein Aperf_G00000092045 [Anoplocephala perfoliata]
MQCIGVRLFKIECSLSRLLISVSLSSTSTTSSPNPDLKSSDSKSGHFDDVYMDGVRSGELSHDPLALARFLASRVVAYGKHFIVLDKPANLSVYGHARSASPLISSASPQSTPLSIYECLPHLREVLSESNPFSLTNTFTNTPLSVLVAKCRDAQRAFSDAWSPPSEIFIVEPLPAAYSGLILLATSKGYAEFARNFYIYATKNYTFHVVCWGSPSRDSVEVERFPLAVHKASESVSVAYRPTDDKLTSVARKKGALMFKRVGHHILSRGSGQNSGCLVELVCNSCYAGLPEVYLLHEGCEVIGEDIQASRLVKTAGAPMVLPPTMAKLGEPVPAELLKIFGLGNLLRSALPTHIHRSQLLIPSPIPGLPEGGTFSRHLRKPLGRIFNTQRDIPILSWKKFPVNEEKNVFFLSATSYTLPQYFIRTLEKLGLDIPFKHIDKYGQ